MITLQFKLDLSKEGLETLKDLMRRQSSCTRYAYKRLLEGEERRQNPKKVIFGGRALKEDVREGVYTPYKLWQAIGVAFTLPILGKSINRDFSPLKSYLVDWGRVAVRLAPVLGAGAMADPNTACRVLGLSESGGIQIALPELYRNIQFG